MKRAKRIATYGAAMMVAALAGTASAQVVEKTVQGETATLTVTVKAIEKASRELTVQKEDGTYDVLYVPEGVQRFDTVKVGDKITAKYSESLMVRLQAPGAKPVDKESIDLTRSSTAASGTVGHQKTITATISKIDPKAPSITFSGPNGWEYSTHVKDTAALAKVRVGDKVDVTWTESMIVSLEAAK